MREDIGKKSNPGLEKPDQEIPSYNEVINNGRTKPKLWIILIIILSIVLISYVFRDCSDHPLKVGVEKFETEKYVNLTVENIEEAANKKLNLQIKSDDGQYFKNKLISHQKTIRIDLPIGCYTFVLSYLDGSKSPEIIQYIEKVCLNDLVATNPINVPRIDSIKQIENKEKRKWNITVYAQSQSVPLEYSFDNGTTFGSFNQRELDPGNQYVIVVRDKASQTANRSIALGPIQIPAVPVTIQQVQAWLDQLAQGNETARSDFRKYFNEGATAKGMENVNTAYQLMIEIIDNRQKVKITNMNIPPSGTRISSIIVQLINQE